MSKLTSLESIMRTPKNQVAANTPIADAISLMSEQGYTCLLIVELTKVSGIVTERDIVRLALDMMEGDIKDKPISEFMTKNVLTLKPKDKLEHALDLSLKMRIRHIPIVNENDDLLGIINQKDLLQAHAELIEKHSEILEETVKTRTEELERLNHQLTSLSMRDPLTNIGNRRAMDNDLEHTHALSVRNKRPYTVCLIDIDHFKAFNDYYGHQAGDDVLIKVVKLIQSNLRRSDRIYRYGGEEFLMLLPETEETGTKVVIKRIFTSLRQLAIPHCKSPKHFVTICAGIETKHPQADDYRSWAEIVSCADKRLYQAKDNGRNTYVIEQSASQNVIPLGYAADPKDPEKK